MKMGTYTANLTASKAGSYIVKASYAADETVDIGSVEISVKEEENTKTTNKNASSKKTETDYTKEVEVTSKLSFSLDFGFHLDASKTVKVKVESRFINLLKNAVNLGYVTVK